MKQYLFSPGSVTDTWGSVGLFVARLWFGLTMAFGHGLSKIPPSEKFVEGVAGLGFPAPELFAWLATAGEFLGGLGIAAGLMSRLAGFGVAFTMATAALGVHAADPFGKKELPLAYLFFALLIMIAGPGKLSGDAKLGR